MWITEYNLAHEDLASTQAFYNISTEYFDRLDYVERYSLFGAFRSDVSNVGLNAAMLSAGGDLTDIGAWYLGREATGVQPSAGGGNRHKEKNAELRLESEMGVLVAILATAVLMGL